MSELKSEFKIPIEKQRKISIDEAKFILEQAEKVLKETDQSQTIVARTTNLIILVSGLIIALTAYVVKDFFMLDIIFAKSIIITMIYLYILCVLMILNIQGKKYASLSSDPQTFITDEFFKEEYDPIREKFFVLIEIEKYQNKIEHNKKLNRTRWCMFNWYLILTILIPIVFITIYLFFRLFR